MSWRGEGRGEQCEPSQPSSLSALSHPALGRQGRPGRRSGRGRYSSELALVILVIITSAQVRLINTRLVTSILSSDLDPVWRQERSGVRRALQPQTVADTPSQCEVPGINEEDNSRLAH